MKGSGSLRAGNYEVFGFPRKHRIGSVCVGHCDQCGLPNQALFDSFGNEIPDTPLLIVAEATEEDWRRAILADGVESVDDTDLMPYYYFVATD